MSDIYERGTRTLVWLGEEDGHNCRLTASACLKGRTEIITSINELVEHEYECQTRVDQESVENMLRRICKSYNITDRFSGMERWECARHFCSRSYFSRCWVLGEVGVSTQATAFCGGFSLLWSEVVLFALISSDLLTIHRTSLGRFNAIVTCMWTFMTKQTSWMEESIILRETKQSCKDLSVPAIDTLALQVLNTSRGFNASDPRDHVYAFLGHPSLKQFLIRDYTCSVEETNRTFAENFIRSTRSLEILCFVEHNAANINTKLQSWIPQWHQPRLYSTEFRPDWQSFKGDAIQRVLEIDGHSLKVKALLVDKIQMTSAQMELEDFKTTPADQKHQNIVEQLWHRYKKNSEADGEMFVWTLVSEVYPHQHWLIPDFLSYCKTHCSSDFYESLLREPIFANISTTLSMTDWDTQLKEKFRIPGADVRFESYLRRLVHCRLFVTYSGTVGVSPGTLGCGPGTLKTNDCIALILGCPMPLVLRSTKKIRVGEYSGSYQLIGRAYVNELMYGNDDNWIVNLWRQGLPTDLITLV